MLYTSIVFSWSSWVMWFVLYNTQVVKCIFFLHEPFFARTDAIAPRWCKKSSCKIYFFTSCKISYTTHNTFFARGLDGKPPHHTHQEQEKKLWAGNRQSGKKRGGGKKKITVINSRIKQSKLRYTYYLKKNNKKIKNIYIDVYSYYYKNQTKKMFLCFYSLCLTQYM